MRFRSLCKLLFMLTGGLVAALVVVLLTVDFGAYKSDITAALTDVTGRELTVDGDFKIRFGIRPSVTATGVKLANAPWGSRPHMMTARRFEAEIALLPLVEGRVEVKRLILVKPVLYFETDKKGRSNWDLDVSEQDDEAVIPHIGTVVIRDGKATVLDRRTRQRQIVRISRLRLTPSGPHGSFNFDVNGALDGKKMSAKGTLGIPSGMKAGVSPWLVDFTARAGGANIKVVGSVKSPALATGFDLDVTAKGRNFSDLAAWAGLRVPRMGPYRLNGRITDRGARWRVSRLRARFGKSEANGSVTFAVRPSRVFVRATFASSLLDLDAMGLTDTLKSRPKRASRPPTTAASIVSDLDALRGIDASVKLSAGRVRAAGIGLKGVKLNLSISDGVAVLRPVRAGLGGGIATADVTLDATGEAPALALILRTKKVNAAELTPLFGAGDMFKGAVDLDVDLKSRGATISALAAGLNGTFSAVMGKGELRNEYFDMLSTDVIASISPWASPRRPAQINCAVARFDVRNGIAISRATVIDSQRATVVGDGAFDLGREQIDFTVSPSVKNAGLVSLTVPIRISGSMDDPSITLHSGKLAKKTVGAVADLAESIISIVGIGNSSKAQNPCVTALAAPPRRHSLNQTSERPSTVRR
jgi:uncharacterized protein involved in outer membrane biogenesis